MIPRMPLATGIKVISGFRELCSRKDERDYL
jgi:hypothetical protein